MVNKHDLSPREAALKLKVTIDHLYKLIYGGQLPAQKHGRQWRVDAGAVEERRKRLAEVSK